MAAVLVGGPGAVLSHLSAAMLWGIVSISRGPAHLSLPINSNRARGLSGIHVHRRKSLRPQDITAHRNIQVTTPACTIVDLATTASTLRVERAIDQADILDLMDPEALRQELEQMPPRPGRRAVRRLLDPQFFRLTRSELERHFFPIARRAGLPVPETRQWVNGFEVDFCWPDLGLIVEADGLRYHRTAARQTADHVRDQVHIAAGFTPLRFTHWQIARQPAWVEEKLAAVSRRLVAERARPPAPAARAAAPAWPPPARAGRLPARTPRRPPR